MGEIRRLSLMGMKWRAIEKFSLQAVTFFVGIIVARLLTPADYGLIGILGIFIAVSQTLIDSGFSNALIRKQDCNEKDYSTVFYFNFLMGLLCMSILFIGAPLIAKFFNQPLLTDITRVYSINLVIGSLTTVQGAILTKEIKFKPIAKINFISAVGSAIVGLVLAYMGFGVWSLVWQSISANVIKTILYFILIKWRPIFVFSKKSFDELFGYGSKLMFSGLLHTAYSQATTFLIGRFYTPVALGNFSRGSSIAMLPNGMVSGILQSVTFPIFAKLQHDNAVLIEVYRKFMKLNGIILCFASMLMISIAKPLILLLLGSRWEGAIIFLQVMSLTVVFAPLSTLNLNLLQVKGRSDLFLKLEIIKKSISILMLLCSVPFGVLAICIVKVVYEQIALFINTYYTGKLFGVGYFDQLKDYLPYMGLAGVCCLPSLIFSNICDLYIVTLLIGSIISFIFYISILFIRKDALFLEYIVPILKKCLSLMKKKTLSDAI